MTDKVIRGALSTETLFESFQESTRTRNWSVELKECLESAFDQSRNGHIAAWTAALQDLPSLEVSSVTLNSQAVTCSGTPTAEESQRLHSSLFRLSPWRKGPFQVFDVFIDTEWRSNLKWKRLAPHLDLEGRDILDVGCGNGYYGWRMLGAGAKRVVGLDPNLLYSFQFAALRKYLGDRELYILPAGDTIIAPNLRAFNTVFSMGVLYHRKSPIEHLQSLYHALTPGGDLVLETLVIEGDDRQVLIPQDRYAQMRNVWFLPSPGLLERMLAKCGFQEIRLVDMSRTTTEEQRSTEWMTFDSLPKFLDPEDPALTIEGYPAPLRATLLARRKVSS